ncbi:MAG: hypothetical protein V4582_24250 [Pseudomonadota bacterium]
MDTMTQAARMPQGTAKSASSARANPAAAPASAERIREQLGWRLIPGNPMNAIR